ncbi:MAG: response regulator [Anaerolineae bacterium]|nr:response regulator [Anaerolineae bacterium]
MSLNDKTIVVVEDNAVNYNLIVRLLTGLGIKHIKWITSGWQAAEKAADLAPVDLILLDIQLPYADGYAVHKALRANPSLRDAKIVAVTVYADEIHMQRAASEGFDGFIGKPLLPSRFLDQIRQIFDGEAVWTWQQ